jgi:nucleoside-diphosphate-sugar epimerase
MADVRDIAKAHVLALSAPRFGERRKRLILCSRTFNWPEVVALIKQRCPQLVQRLPDASVTAPRLTGAPLDLSLGHEVLGWTDYINWEESILECVRVGLRWEESFGRRAD